MVESRDPDMNDREGEEFKGEEDEWVELRLQGKLPERRANHCSFIAEDAGTDYLYIHGGRDLKEGAIDTMWRLNLVKVQQLEQDPYTQVEWESVCPKGKGPGKISHHTASVQGPQVLFLGGLRGEDSCEQIFVLDIGSDMWSNLSLAGDVLARDDHAQAVQDNGDIFVFGGFVKGSRDNQLACFSKSSADQVSSKSICDASESGPVVRAGHSMVASGNQFFVFGGQDDDNNKLNDVWCFNGSSWEQIEFQEGDLCPIARSGHTAVMHDNKMFVFGGMVELTKELNDLAIFDINTKKFVQADPQPFGEETVEAPKEEASSPMKRGQTMIGSDGMSPTMKRGQTFTASGSPSPTRKRAAGTTLMHNIMQPNACSPPPRKKKITIAAADQDAEKHDGLSSPISIEMKQSFIISNADDSFDAYYQSMRKRGKLGMTVTEQGHATSKQTKFGMVAGKPAARDGHSANVDKRGCMYVFGGDRHQMPFNDLYMIKLM